MTFVDSLIDFLRGSRPKSASVAKERLQLILAHENPSRRGGPDYLPALRQELLGVIAKYVAIDPEKVEVHVERQGVYDFLELNIALPEQPKK
jgi:cell division topological specificity factor